MTPQRSAAALVAGLVLVATPGVAQASWRPTGTGSVRAAATRMPIVSGVTAAATGSSVKVSWPAVEIRSGRPVAGYQILRYPAGADTATVVTGDCSGTTCTETNVPNGAWQYAVRAVHSTWTGILSARVAVTVTAVVVTPGTVTTTFPVNGQTYTSSTWSRLAGRATASSGSALTTVRFSVVKKSTGLYWNGTDFGASSEQLTAVTSADLANWDSNFPIGRFAQNERASYTLRVVAADSSGATVSTSTDFIVDRMR